MAFTARAETVSSAAALTTPFSFTINKATGVVDGDIMFMFLTIYIATPATVDSVPAGWQVVATNATSNTRWYLYYKIASGEGVSYTWSLTKSCRYYAVNAAYTAGDWSVASLSDITAISNTLYATAGVPVRAATMSVPAVNSPLLYFASVYSTTSKTFTKPSIPTTGWVEDSDVGGTTPDLWATNGSMIWAGSGATGVMDITCSATITTEKHAFVISLKPASAPITLVIQDGTIAHSIDNIVITQEHNLVIADAVQANNIDNIAITQVHVLAIQDGTIANTIDNIVIEHIVAAINLVIQNSVIANTIDNIVITQDHNLTIQDGAVGGSADNIVITQVHNLAIDDSVLGNNIDNIVITQVHELAVADGQISNTIDNVIITQAHNLAIADGVVFGSIDNIEITQIHQLLIADGVIGGTIEAIVITQEHNLLIDDLVQSHSIDNIAITQVHVLSINDGVLQHTIDNLSITQEHNLLINDSVIANSIDNLIIEIFAGILLDIHKGTIGNNIDNLTITHVHNLDIHDSVIENFIDNIIIEIAILLYFGTLKRYSAGAWTDLKIETYTNSFKKHNSAKIFLDNEWKSIKLG